MPLSELPFPRYTDFDPEVPVWCVTPGRGGCYHRFFDTSPISPSGRYLAVTRMSAEDRVPRPGDVAEVVVVDLETGREWVPATTRGWDTQLGAQVQWGADDTQLFFNDVDVDQWRPFGVRLDPASGARTDLEGTVYMVSRDGRWAASADLTKMHLTQKGYGVHIPEERVRTNAGAPDDDGLFVTDTDTGRSRLLVSLARIVEEAEPAIDRDAFAAGDFYGFHVKWTVDGSRLMLVLRWRPHGNEERPKLRNHVITCAADGSDIHVAMPSDLWSRGGHHPDWCPDNEHWMMNLKLDGQSLSLVRALYDGTGLEPLTTAVPGSGHPSLHPDRRHIVTDTYLHESLAFGDGTTPIRWIDLEEGTARCLVRVDTDPPFPGPIGELRMDPHPAWDRAYGRITFNACPGGVRRVYVADLSGLLD